MSLPTLDFDDSRRRMVDSQIRPNKVTDPRILEAMRGLPREQFLPDSAAPMAYVDEDVPLGNGRFLMEPMVIARLIQLAHPVPGETALVVGAGTGYGAALLAACGARVTALEDDAALLAIARRALAAHGPSVVVVSGPLAAGWARGAPWDLILIEGAVARIPQPIADQLRSQGGRLVTVLIAPDGVKQGVLGEAYPTGLRTRPEFDCATPELPGLRPVAEFVF